MAASGDLRKRKIRLALTLLTVAWMVSCAYEPTGLNFKDITKTQPQATFTLNNYSDDDTIRMYQSSNFQYDITASNVKDNGVTVKLGNNLIYTGSTSGNFWIPTNLLVTGTTTLKIEFTVYSNTGSLADKLGEETVQLWHQWAVIIDVDIPPAPVVTFSEENGFLKVNWTPYTQPNFKSYTVVRSGLFPTSTTFIITDPKKNFMIDSAYAGGTIGMYDIHASTNAQSGSVGSGQYFEHPDVHFDYRISDTTLSIQWSKTRFPSARKNVVITDTFQPRFQIDQATDTSIVFRPFHAMFGGKIQIEFQINPKYSDYVVSYYPYENSNPVGANHHTNLLTLTYNLGIQGYVGQSAYNRITWYDADLHPVDSIDSFNSGVCIPFSGNSIYGSQGGSIIELDLTDKSQRYASIQNSGALPGYIQPLEVSGGNSIVMFNYHDFANARYGTNLTNLNTNVTNYRPESTSPMPVFNVSDDGRYATSGSPRSVYTTVGDVLTLVGSVPDGYFGFRPDNNDQIFVQSSGDLVIYNSASCSLFKTVTRPNPSSYFTNYDPVTHNALYRSSQSNVDLVYLVNIDNGQTKTVGAFSQGSYRLLNGVLFDTNGYYARILP